MEYDMIHPWRTLDKWQERVLQTKGDIAIRAGRQSGKSTIISIKVGELAVNTSKQTIMIISKTERQALLLFEKVLAYISIKHKWMIKGGKDRPTRHKITLINGSVIHSLPTGDTGYGLMGFTINLLVVDEAAFIPEEVFNAVVPALSAVGGDMWLLSTPQGKHGYFFDAFQDKSYTTFHVSSEECIRNEKHKEFLERQKERLPKSLYKQWYMGEFVEGLFRLFSDTLINEICTGNRPLEFDKEGTYFLGVDIGHMGEDESSFEVIKRVGNNLYHVENQTTIKTRTTETAENIVQLEIKYNFSKIYIDARGVGAGVFDILYDNDRTRRKIQDVDNLKKNLNLDGTEKKKTNKEIIYMNTLRLMHERRVVLLNDNDVKASLRSVIYTETDKGLRIYGDNTHITEGLIRALWCVKDKGLNIFAYYI